jgi:hypothetical protein
LNSSQKISMAITEDYPALDGQAAPGRRVGSRGRSTDLAPGEMITCTASIAPLIGSVALEMANGVRRHIAFKEAPGRRARRWIACPS